MRIERSAALCAAALALAAAPAAPGGDADEPCPIPFPHPVITEVLFQIPQPVYGGDANLDGVRNPAGDQFVELMNPHDQPINLKGYTISDGRLNPEWRLTWTFPDFELGPGEVVVVFNGYRQDEIPGPDGDADRAPRGPNKHFGGGWVFSMHVVEGWRTFTHEGDFVLLIAPDGAYIDAVTWGAADAIPPLDTLRVEYVEASPIGSYQRPGPWKPLMLHTDIDLTHYSPGRVPGVTRRTADDEQEDRAGER